MELESPPVPVVKTSVIKESFIASWHGWRMTTLCMVIVFSSIHMIWIPKLIFFYSREQSQCSQSKWISRWIWWICSRDEGDGGTTRTTSSSTSTDASSTKGFDTESQEWTAFHGKATSSSCCYQSGKIGTRRFWRASKLYKIVNTRKNTSGYSTCIHIRWLIGECGNSFLIEIEWVTQSFISESFYFRTFSTLQKTYLMISSVDAVDAMINLV